jgi:hypothetical protein
MANGGGPGHRLAEGSPMRRQTWPGSAPFFFLLLLLLLHGASQVRFRGHQQATPGVWFGLKYPCRLIRTCTPVPAG